MNGQFSLLRLLLQCLLYSSHIEGRSAVMVAFIKQGLPMGEALHNTNLVMPEMEQPKICRPQRGQERR